MAGAFFADALAGALEAVEEAGALAGAFFADALAGALEVVDVALARPTAVLDAAALAVAAFGPAAWEAERLAVAPLAAVTPDAARWGAVPEEAPRRGAADRVVADARVLTGFVTLFFVVGLGPGGARCAGTAGVDPVRPARAATALVRAAVDFRDGGTWPSSAPPYWGYNDRMPGPVPSTRG